MNTTLLKRFMRMLRGKNDQIEGEGGTFKGNF